MEYSYTEECEGDLYLKKQKREMKKNNKGWKLSPGTQQTESTRE